MSDFLDWMMFRSIFGHNSHNDYSRHDYGRHDYGHSHDYGYNRHSHRHHYGHYDRHHSGHNLANDMMDYWMFKNIFGDDD